MVWFGTFLFQDQAFVTDFWYTSFIEYFQIFRYDMIYVIFEIET